MIYQIPVPTEPLASEQFTVERKAFSLDLKENERGRFIKITEDVGGRRDVIILPVAGAAEFHQLLGRLIEFESAIAE